MIPGVSTDANVLTGGKGECFSLSFIIIFFSFFFFFKELNSDLVPRVTREEVD